MLSIEDTFTNSVLSSALRDYNTKHGIMTDTHIQQRHHSNLTSSAMPNSPVESHSQINPPIIMKSHTQQNHHHSAKTTNKAKSANEETITPLTSKPKPIPIVRARKIVRNARNAHACLSSPFENLQISLNRYRNGRLVVENQPSWGHERPRTSTPIPLEVVAAIEKDPQYRTLYPCAKAELAKAKTPKMQQQYFDHIVSQKMNHEPIQTIGDCDIAPKTILFTRKRSNSAKNVLSHEIMSPQARQYFNEECIYFEPVSNSKSSSSDAAQSDSQPPNSPTKKKLLPSMSCYTIPKMSMTLGVINTQAPSLAAKRKEALDHIKAHHDQLRTSNYLRATQRDDSKRQQPSMVSLVKSLPTARPGRMRRVSSSDDLNASSLNARPPKPSPKSDQSLPMPKRDVSPSMSPRITKIPPPKERPPKYHKAQSMPDVPPPNADTYLKRVPTPAPSKRVIAQSSPDTYVETVFDEVATVEEFTNTIAADVTTIDAFVDDVLDATITAFATVDAVFSMCETSFSESHNLLSDERSKQKQSVQPLIDDTIFDAICIDTMVQDVLDQVVLKSQIRETNSENEILKNLLSDKDAQIAALTAQLDAAKAEKRKNAEEHQKISDQMKQRHITQMIPTSELKNKFSQMTDLLNNAKAQIAEAKARLSISNSNQSHDS